MVDPDAATTLRQYFKDGTVKQFTDAQNRVTTYTYDALQRVLVKTRSDGSTVTYGYDEAAGRPGSGPPIGHATSIQDSSTGIRQEFQYDQLGRLRLSRHVIDQTPYEISQILDSLGRTQALTYPDNSSIWYTYRADGRIGRVTSGPQWPVADNLKYTPAGEIGSILLGHGATVSNTYDATTAWLTRSLTSVPQYGSVVLDRTYGYTPGGHLASVTDNTDPAHPKSQTFTLDNLYRLTRAGSPATYGTLDYGYDAIGNLRSKEGVGFNFQNGHPHQATSTSPAVRRERQPHVALRRRQRRHADLHLQPRRPARLRQGGPERHDHDGVLVHLRPVGTEGEAGRSAGRGLHLDHPPERSLRGRAERRQPQVRLHG